MTSTQTATGAQTPEGSMTYNTAFTPAAPQTGQTWRSVVASVMQKEGPAAVWMTLETLMQHGYFNQFTVFDTAACHHLMAIVSGIRNQHQAGGDFFVDMLRGTGVHLGNVAANYDDQPAHLLTARAFGPAGSSLESKLW